MMAQSDDEEGFMDVVADLPADAQSAEPVQQCEGLFCDPPVDAQPGGLEFDQQQFVQLLPDAGFGLLGQPPPACHPRPVSRLLR
jgi:hypothetical protein